MPENFYDRLDEILDGAREGQKRNDTVDALDALYAERQTAEAERLRAELRDRRTDDLDIRGILKPAPGVGDPAVPMPLGPALAPAIEWIVNDRDRLRLQLESAEQERDAARGVAKGRTELADQMRTERDAVREQVKRVREVIAGALAREKQLLEWAEDVKSEERRTGIQAVAFEARTIADRLTRALDGTEPGR